MRAAWRLGLAAILVTGAAAGAPPDHWDRARSPKSFEEEKTLDEVADQLEQARSTRSPLIRQTLASQSRAAIEHLAPGAGGGRALFLLGNALHLLDDDSGVVRVLAPAVKRFSEHPLVAGALFELAVAYAKIDSPPEEISAYDQALEREIDPNWRSVVLSNRAESRAKLGDVAGAIRDYQESIQLLPNSVLPRWGLAVIYDRQGDLSRALEEGGFAWMLDHEETSQLDRNSVFFVPAYDRWWYHGLRQLAAAHRSESLEEKIQHLERAARFYELYTSQAPSTERWVPLAKVRMKRSEAQILRLKKQLPKAKSKPAKR